MFEGRGSSERVKKLCQQLKPFLGMQADQVYSAYLLEDKAGREQIEIYLESLLAGKMGDRGIEASDSLIPPPAEHAAGEYELGNVVYGSQKVGPFGLREKEWIQHVGIFGRTGAGKTNMGYLTLQQLQKHQKPFLVFDWKRNYRDLLVLPEFQDVEVYTIGRDTAPFLFNPLIPPPGIPPKTWLKKIIEVIAHAYMLGNGVLYLLQQSVDAVYEQCGLYSGEMHKDPTLRDVFKLAKTHNAKGREAGWLSSLMRALASLCFGEMDHLINRGNNANIQDLLKKPVILELDALTQADKVFFIQALLLWIHHYRMGQGEREHFRHAVLIEEAHHVLSGERRSLLGGQSIMEITFREIREFGESLIILDQHPSQISLPALGNTYTTICLNLKHSKDVSAMGQAMLLDTNDRQILGTLEVGQAVVKLQGRGIRPFMMEIPEFHLKKGTFSDEMVASRMKEKIQATVGMINPPVSDGESDSEVEASVPELDDLSVAFLKDINDFPESGVANRYKRMGISVRQGQRLKARLVEEGLIEETLETTDQGTKRVIRLTGKAGRTLEVDPG